MTKKCFAALALLLGCSWIASPWQSGARDAKTVIADAMKALGAENLKSIEYSGSGYDFTLGQAPNPSSPWPKFIDKTYTRLISLDPVASRMQRVRMQGENPPRGGGQQPVVGEQQQNQVVAPGSPQAATLMDDLMMSVPYAFLKAASAASDTKVSSKTVGGKKYTVLTFTALNKAPASGYLNSQGVLERVETKIDNNVLGDIQFETTFEGYKDFGGVKFPTHIVQKQGGYPVLDLTLTDVKPNAPVSFEQQAKGKSDASAVLYEPRSVYRFSKSPQAFLRSAIASLQRYSALYRPYPWRTYTMVGMADLPEIAGGLEYPTLVYQPAASENAAHETAHQWFYSLVGNDQAHDPWLDEGLATWAESAVNGAPPFEHATIPPESANRIGQPMSYWDRLDERRYFLGAYLQSYRALLSLGPRPEVDCALRRYVLNQAYRVAR